MSPPSWLVDLERSLAEECALTAEGWRELGRFWAAPAYSTEFVHAFEATDLSSTEGALLDDDEDVEVVRIPLAGSLERLSDSASIAALALWLEAR